MAYQVQPDSYLPGSFRVVGERPSEHRFSRVLTKLSRGPRADLSSLGPKFIHLTLSLRSGQLSVYQHAGQNGSVLNVQRLSLARFARRAWRLSELLGR